MTYQLYLLLTARLLLIWLGITPLLSFGQDCDAVLRGGVFNTVSIAASAASTQSFNEYIYAADFSTHQQAIDAGLSIGTIVYGVPLQLGATFTKQQKDTWRSNNVQYKTASSASLTKFSSLYKTADPTILREWRKCVEVMSSTKVGLSSWIQEINSNSALLHVNWVPTIGDNGLAPVIKSSSISGGIRLDNIPTLLPVGYKLQSGVNNNTLQLIRRPNEAIVVVVNTSRGDTYCVLDPAPKPTITGFSLSATDIKYGESSTLFWSVSDATQVDIDNGIGSVQANGSVNVSPQQTTVYKITATNSIGSISQFITVKVGDKPIPPPFLTGVSVNFFTTDNDKDNDTNVNVFIKAAGQTVAKWSGGNGTKWNKNTNNNSFNLTVLTPIKRDQLMGIGQAILIEETKNNDEDEWHFNWGITLIFSDGSQAPYNWNGENVDNDRATVTHPLP